MISPRSLNRAGVGKECRAKAKGNREDLGERIIFCIKLHLSTKVDQYRLESITSSRKLREKDRIGESQPCRERTFLFWIK
jgi:hypothetical protein